MAKYKTKKNKQAHARAMKRKALENNILVNEHGKVRQVKIESVNKTRIRTPDKITTKDNNKGLYEYSKPRYGVKVRRKYYKVYDLS